MSTQSTLIYVHDPMCSWCWGFAPVWQRTCATLSRRYGPECLSIRYVAGGLAPDTSEPMSAAQAKLISGHWQTIADKLGTEFNFDFWAKNTPRRSTYPACRAVISARELGGPEKEIAMIEAIQKAYYLNAENPSSLPTLIHCAERIDLDPRQFKKWVESPECDALLQHEISYGRSIGGKSFPSLFLKRGRKTVPVPFDYQTEHITLDFLEGILQRRAVSGTDGA